uniref:probable serine/threonine-protein kinase PBL19 n=1 Tax=Erigeron canadensis TaxID=72917 RepID=UPI001CB9D3EE|nr:probable serine/threonine-protein kinase PBL19 [Erigeron canadensis]XP_043623274.1 probable serine/threonine-protein kinase PBL19 [Erigeron canadensis]XP_043623275.1 probable serine/threonine-protein kinase PBL19 [Erigeron canadensis]
MYKAFNNKMKCFHYFKDKTKGRGQRSEPILRAESNLSTSEDVSSSKDRVTMSSGSANSKDRVTKSSGSANSPRGIIELYEENAGRLRVFTYAELRQATNDFTRLRKIGEGGFGCVYKGSIKPVDGRGDPIVVAIKKLNRDGFQGHKQWVAEVQFLGVVDHPNLVKLIGYCSMDGERGIQRLLVYEFMPNKSLEDHLFRNSHEALPWQRRLQIMLGAAQGLAYLHEELEAQVIFRDFKTSNILLDEDFNPKLSDFGLAREGPTEGNTHVSTAVMGTHGYAAPDYIETGHLTAKSDVWSFGIVLYEILTGRKSLERNRPKEDQKLLDWVRRYPIDSKKFGIIIDPRLEARYSLTAARKIAKLADSCLLKSAKDRPKMSQVVESLKQIIEVSAEGSPSNKSFKMVDEEPEELAKKPKSKEASESSKRRLTQLAKLSEHVGGVSKKGFMIMHRAKVS